MYLKRAPFFALVLLLLALPVAVQADKVDDYVKAQMERQHVPGVSLVVIKDDKIIKSVGYGLANVELNVPATPDTVYKIGSVSKQFIATGIMLLVQDGKITLDDPVSKFLEGTPDTWKPITVRHLLTHTSGIVREAPGFDPFKIQNDADVIKTAYPLPLRFTPGEKYEYCNVGYFTLAEIIHKVSGKPWGDFLTERVFAPLGMNSTRTTNMTDLVPNRANGYAWRNGKLQNAAIYFALRPSGAFLSTVTDLAKWDAALNAGTILKKTTLEQMWTPVKLTNGSTSAYGFGWVLEPIRGHKQVNHGGSLPGFRAQYTRFVDHKISIAVLTNGDNANAEAIAIGVANFYIPGLIPERVVAKVDPKVFDGYTGVYQGEQSATLSVTRDADKLMIQQGTGEKRELSPESETVFFVKDAPRSTYSFIKDAGGQALLVIHQDGKEVWRGRKIK
ncbi:MAG TPA: serine hydrolase domain-containing protein [Pyrinomonadaceae bacterium]|nr:serine hydrolase domain-containing protein [Pyrinomonadaceae bacterium]